MGQTAWHPRTNFEQSRQWLLTDGTIVAEPALEQSGSGRKVRVAGTDLSAFTKDMDELVMRTVQAYAEKNAASIWMPLHDYEERVEDEAGFKPAETRAELYVLDQNFHTKTNVWWRFKHPTLPIEALVVVSAGRVHPNGSSAHKIETAVMLPRTAPVGIRAWEALHPAAYRVQNHTFDTLINSVSPNTQAAATAREFVRDDPATWAAWLGRNQYTSERALVEGLLNQVRNIDDFETIQVPDLRDPENPTWMDLELYETNMHSGFTTDLTDYLDGTPTLTEALRLYRELQTCLRGIGMVIDDKTENDFQKALLSGDASGVTVSIESVHDGETQSGFDYQHSLTMHLPTGTFVVNCHAQVNHGEIAEKWDEARTVASLTGEEDTLIAYAREAAQRSQQKRARATIRERKHMRQE